MKKTKKQRIKKMHFLFHRGILKISLKGIWGPHFQISKIGNSTFKRKGKKLIVEAARKK